MSQAMTADVVIIGGGLHGCSAALHLSRRNLSCIIVEKDHVGRHASSANAGGVRTLMRDPREIPLALASLDLWHDMRSLVDDDCGFEETGQLRIAETPEDFETLRKRAELVKGLGHSHEELIDEKELYRLLPHMRPGCVGGLICRRDGSGNPLIAMRAFRAAVLKAGVTLHEGVAATGAERLGEGWRVNTTAGPVEAGMVVNCAGAWADRVAGWFGDHITVTPAAPMGMITARLPHLVGPVVSSVSRYLSLKQFENGTVLISGHLRGDADRDRNIAALKMGDFAERARTVLDLFPQFSQAQVVRFWAGIEAITDDGSPIIGPSANSPNVIHAFGFNGHGFELGPKVGAVVAEIAATGGTNTPLDGLTIHRFLDNAKMNATQMANSEEIQIAQS